MADLPTRLPDNVSGRFYVDDTCIYCDLCVDAAPTVFHAINDYASAVVFHQPSTPEELELALWAAYACPTDSIGSDGDRPLRKDA